MEGMDAKTSMLYWYPKIRDLWVPMPKTEIIALPEGVTPQVICEITEGKWPQVLEPLMVSLAEAGDRLGYPFFLRTDLTSAKHRWKESCYVTDKRDLYRSVYTLVEFSFGCDLLGLPVNAFVARKYIPMATIFTAFRYGLPVNPERRIFIRDGKALCYHPYWNEEAIEDGTPPEMLPQGWRQILEKANSDPPGGDRRRLLYQMAEEVGERLPGYWSVDFCLGKDNMWYLIDMAEGERSWHPEDCPTLSEKDGRM